MEWFSKGIIHIQEPLDKNGLPLSFQEFQTEYDCRNIFNWHITSSYLLKKISLEIVSRSNLKVLKLIYKKQGQKISINYQIKRPTNHFLLAQLDGITLWI